MEEKQIYINGLDLDCNSFSQMNSLLENIFGERASANEKNVDPLEKMKIKNVSPKPGSRHLFKDAALFYRIFIDDFSCFIYKNTKIIQAVSEIFCKHLIVNPPILMDKHVSEP